MNTREFFVADLSGAAPTPAGSEPVPRPSAKPERAFSAVIEQKLRAKNPAPKSASSSAPQTQPGCRKTAKGRTPSPSNAVSKLQSTSSAAANLPDERTNVSQAGRTKLAFKAAEEDTAPEGAVLLEDTSSEDQTAIPNIIPFPLTAVIIPFPTLTPEPAWSLAPTSASGEGTAEESLFEQTIVPLPQPTAAQNSREPTTGGESFDDVEIDVPWPRAHANAAAPSATNIETVDFRNDAAVQEASAAMAGDTAVSDTPPLLSARGAKAQGGALTHLPSAVEEGENSAQIPGARQGPSRSGLVETPWTRPISAVSGEITSGNVVADPAGIAAAPQGFEMDSKRNTEPSRAFLDRHQQALDELDGISVRVSEDEPNPRPTDSTARSLDAMDWQTGRPVGFPDRPTLSASGIPPSQSNAEAADASATVERLSQLVLRETSLLRQHGSDAMSVVLRPDAQTELFVHFSQRNGQLQAAIRCERGDFQQLNTLWPQLQESLAHQKVTLGPLQETSSADLGNSGLSLSADAGGSRPGQDPGHRGWVGDSSLEETDGNRRGGLAGSGRVTEPASEVLADREGRGTQPTARPSWETWA